VFVAYLWIYTMALVSFWWPPRACRLDRTVARTGSVGRAAPYRAIGRVWRPTAWPCCRAFLPRMRCFGDWYNHMLFATVFLLGFLLARADDFWDAIERQRWLALALAAAFFLAFLALRWSRESATRHRLWLKLYGGLAYGFYQWLFASSSSSALQRWLTADSAVRRYLTDAIFPFYIVHQTAIIMIAHNCTAGIFRLAGSGHRDIGHIGACVLTYENDRD